MTSTKLLRKSSLYSEGLCPSPRKTEQELKQGPGVTLEDKAWSLFLHITGPLVQEWYYIMGGAIPHLLLIRKTFSLFLYEVNSFFLSVFTFSSVEETINSKVSKIHFSPSLFAWKFCSDPGSGDVRRSSRFIVGQ